jgi:MFS family permease
LKADPRIRVVLAANFLAVAARMSLVTFLGIWFVREAGIDLATVGLAFLAESALRGAAAPLFGALSDRIGRRPLLICAALTNAVVLPCFLLVEGTLSLLAWSVGLGLAGAVNMPVASALLLDLSSAERRQSTLALNYTVMSVAYTLGVTPAGYIAEWSYGALAAIAGAGYLLVALLYALALRGALPIERLQAPENALRAATFVLRDPRFLAFAALAFVFPFSMGLVVSVTPLFGAAHGLGEGYVGLVLGGNSIIVALLGLPVAARIEPRGPFRFLGLAAALVSLGLFCYAWTGAPAAALLLGTVVFSFGELIFSSAVPAAVARLAPAGRRGAYQGGWSLVASLSMGGALAVTGVLHDAAGWQGAWLAYAGLALAAAAALHNARSRFAASLARQ